MINFFLDGPGVLEKNRPGWRQTNIFLRLALAWTFFSVADKDDAKVKKTQKISPKIDLELDSLFEFWCN